MSRNSPSDLHLRAQRDDIHGGPPAKWPRREADRPAVVRHGRGKGKGVGPHLTNLFPPKSKRQTNTLLNHRAARQMAKGPGWYRSKSGRWHDLDANGDATCGAQVLRVAGPRTGPPSKACSDCRPT